MNRIYPEYWIEADELEKNEYAHKIIQISDKKNKKIYKKVVGEFTKMVDMTKFPKFQIIQISMYQQHHKWHMYSKDLKKVNSKNKSTNPNIESEKYLLNIFRFQNHEQILQGDEGVSFDMRKNRFEATVDKLNHASNNWLGDQANYFTNSFEFAHIYSDRTPFRTNHLFLAKCIIGNCKETAAQQYRVPRIGAEEFDSLSTNVAFNSQSINGVVAASAKVFALYNNDKSYPEFLIEYKVE